MGSRDARMFRYLTEGEVLREGDLEQCYLDGGLGYASKVWEPIAPWMVGMTVVPARANDKVFRRPIDPLIQSLVNALQEALDAYKGLVDSGDCGFWEPEEEPWFQACREQLERGKAAL